MVLAPTWLGRLQQDWRNPPQPPSTTPPPSQQNRKNSHEPVAHWLWSPTKNLSWGPLAGGRRRRGGDCCCCWWGRVKKNRSWLPPAQDSGPRPCLCTEKKAAWRSAIGQRIYVCSHVTNANQIWCNPIILTQNLLAGVKTSCSHKFTIFFGFVCDFLSLK